MSPLEQQLNEMRQRSDQLLSPEVSLQLTEAIEQLKRSGLSHKALGVGDEMIQFALPNAVGDITCTQNLLKHGPLVISFYRGGWCPYCNLELKALQNYLPEIRAANATLLAISPEAPDNSLSTQEKNALDFCVLTDKDNDVAKAFGLVFQFDEQLKSTYRNLNINLNQINDSDVFELPLPASYVIDGQGIIRFAFVEEDYRLRADPKQLIAALQGLSKT
jgi:peroxiredoxin